MTKLVKDKWIEDSLEYLASSSEQTAAAKAKRVRAEFERKRLKSRLIISSPEKTVLMKEAWAESHDDYLIACENEVQAIEEDEWHRAQRNKADAIIEAWRSEQANHRTGKDFK
jgi:hypothetical protein